MSPGFGLDSFGTGPFGSGGAVLQLTNAFAVTTNSVRVSFNVPPQQISNTSAGDILNPDTWSIIDGLTGALFTILTVVPVGISTTTFDVFVLESFAGQEPLQILTSTLLAPNGDSLSPPRFFNFVGVASIAQLAAQQAASHSNAAKDIANPPAPTGSNSLAGTLIVTSGGDYATETGTALLKKLIIRRLTTPRGGFFHLPSYGVGLQVKEKIPITDLVKLKSAIEAQVREEPEVQDVQAVVSFTAKGVLTVLLNVKERVTGGSFDIPLQVTQQGFQL